MKKEEDVTVMTPAEVGAWLKVKPRELKRLGVPSIPAFNGHPKTVRYLKADVLKWLKQWRNLK